MTATADDWGDPFGPGILDAAEAWASSPATPAQPPQQVLDCVAAHGWLLLAALKNPAIPQAVKAALARSCRGPARSLAVEHALWDNEPAGLLLTLAPAMTPAALARYVSRLAHPVDSWQRTAADRASDRGRLAEVMRAFTRSADPRCRALAAQSFPLSASARHQFAAGQVSAPRLASDPVIAVRVALARNEAIRQLPDDAPGQAVRRSLLEDAAPRVRAAARRAGLHVTTAQVNAALAVAWGEAPPGAVSGPPVRDALDDPDPRVRATAVRAGIASLDGRRWARVASDASAIVRAAAATSGYRAPRWVWARLASDPDARVRKAVARSRWAPPAVLRRLLSDADASVAGAARARDPLRLPVTLPSAAGRAERRPDLLAGPRRRDQWLALRLSVAGLTVAQQAGLADCAARNPGDRQEARNRMISELRASQPAAEHLLLAWDQWGPMLGLTARSSAWDSPDERLRRYYQQADASSPMASGALTLLDAALATLGSRGEAEASQHDEAILCAPWRQACAPVPTTIAAAYGPHADLAFLALTKAGECTVSDMDRLLAVMASSDAFTWTAASREAQDAGKAWGFP
jgi:hypothetical protein